jgi:hypothetical protein
MKEELPKNPLLRTFNDEFEWHNKRLGYKKPERTVAQDSKTAFDIKFADYVHSRPAYPTGKQSSLAQDMLRYKRTLDGSFTFNA